MWYREGRPKWLGPIPYEYPDHLQGEAPGDYGFDILGLARDPVNFEKYFKYVLYSIPSYVLFLQFMHCYLESLF